MGTRAKPGNQLVYHICIHLLNPHWTMPRQAVNSTQQHKLHVSLIISKTNRTVKRNIITCKPLCHVHSACSSTDCALFYYME